jgi:hypothetical protein
VISGPHPVDENDPEGREFDGRLSDWDIAGAVALHGVSDFSIRLAAYYNVEQVEIFVREELDPALAGVPEAEPAAVRV